MQHNDDDRITDCEKAAISVVLLVFILLCLLVVGL